MKEMIIEYFFLRICDDILTVFDALILVQSGLGIVAVLVIHFATAIRGGIFNICRFQSNF